MGKGEIQSHVANGNYIVKLVYSGKARVAARIAQINAQITYLTDKIAAMDEGVEKDVAELQLAGLQKSLVAQAMPADPVVYAFCADLTEDLTGEVGTIEVPGERGQVNIQPGYGANAVFDPARDGQLQPSVAGTPASVMWNLSMLPGWQAWMPTYRYGTIVADSIDFDANTCSVCLDPAYSSARNLGINRGNGFSECDHSGLAGLDQFCIDNPAHPTCINTTVPTPISVNDEVYAVIQQIQGQVNSEHEYQSDKSGYGVGELWAIMGAGDKGDCEDFALTKMQALIDYGFPVANMQMAAVATDKAVDHAVLVIRTSNRGTLVLDNRFGYVQEMASVPYRFFAYQQAGTTWKSYTTMLEAVPIEYMNCNAAAFADGDEVLVEFTGQDFAQPKVIGFASNPHGCISGALFFFTAFASPWDKLFGYNYSIASFAYNKTAELTGQPTYLAACGTPDSGTTVHFLGGDTDNLNTSPAQWNKTTKQNYQYTLATDAWAIKTDMNHSRAYFGCFSTLAGGVFAVCGWNRPATFYSSIEKYTPSTDSWAAKASNISLTEFGEVVLSGFGYTWGGSSNAQWSGVGATNRRYDPDANTWAARGSLPKSMAFMCAFEDFAAGKGYMAGGATIGQWDSGKNIDVYGVYLTERCYEYDPETNAWVRKTDYPTHGCEGAYYAGADPPGWYINPDDCKTPAGYGPWNVPAAGGNDQGFVVQKAVIDGGGLYHVLPTSKYQPSTDSWTVADLVPERISPFYSADNGCGCAI